MPWCSSRSSIPRPPTRRRRREARGELRRLVRLTGESPKSLPRRLVDDSPPLPRARGGLPRLHAAEPAAGGLDRQTICHDARRPAGPDPGGKSGPHAGGRQVRSRAGTPFLDLCLLVDSANDPPRARAAAQRLSDLLRDDPEARQDPACQAAAPANARVRALPSKTWPTPWESGPAKWRACSACSGTPLSIDEAGVKDGSRTLAELVADPRQECLSDRLDQGSLERRIDEILGNLDIRERQVLRMRYGLQGEQPLSLGDIGKVLAREQGADPPDRRKRDVQAAAAAARRAVRPVLSRRRPSVS